MSQVWTLLKKELTDSLRDRRTLFLMLVLPIALYPGMLLLMGQLTLAGKAQLANAQLDVALCGPDAAALLPASRAPARTRFVSLERSEAEEALRAQTIAALVDAPAGTHAALGQGGQAVVQLVFTQRHDRSIEARERMMRLLHELDIAAVAQRLEAMGLPGTFAEPIKTEELDLDFRTNMGPVIASRLLPVILLVMLFAGSFYAAIDVTAGEKERGTFETLLVAPVRPIQVMAAKYLTVALIGTVATLVNLAAMGGTFRIGLQLNEGVKASMSLTAGQVGMLVLVLLPAALLVSGVSLVVASLARNFKEAQNLLTPVMTVGLAPGLATLMPGFELTSATSLVPLLNVALLVKAVILGNAHWQQVALSMLSGAVFCTLTVALAAMTFQSEALRFGGTESWRELFRFGGPQR